MMIQFFRVASPRLLISLEAGQEPVDLGQEVFPGGIALRHQMVAAVERHQAAVRDQRSQQP
jgi:hypothetical protein